MKINPITAVDFYKTGHAIQYPRGTELVYSNFTARSDQHAKVSSLYDGKTAFFGLQGFIKWFLVDTWNREFFYKPKREVIAAFKRRVDTSLGEGSVSVDQVAALHDLGYLPIHIKALPEGSRVDIKVPYFTVKNTRKEFYWLTNYIETVTSAEVWKPITAATIAYEYRRVMRHYAELTGSSLEFADWQCHDFSMRGMSGVHDASSTGAAHLLSHFGTDTIPAIDYLENYYFAQCEADLIGGSVPATEHSVMCMGGKVDEIETFRNLINNVYPSGIVSIVSDTWDFWKVVTEYAATLKEEILTRTPNALGQAKVVFRPDSGDPVKIICGDPDAPVGSPEHDGAVMCLWQVFGGTWVEGGDGENYRTLHERVGLIYGDSITIERQEEILKRLMAKGFSAGNIVFGVGSYTYQYITRDTFGMAMKATYGVVNGEGRELFKDPITDSGTKKSAKGLLRVEKEGDNFVLYDQQTVEQEELGALRTVFKDGEPYNMQRLSAIRDRLKNS